MTFDLRNVFHWRIPPRKSLVPRLLKNNTARTERERPLASEALVNAQVEPVNSQALALSTRLVHVQEHESALCPIHLLPTEVLALIFIHCLPDLTSKPHDRHSWTSIPSFQISWVCRYWRNISINTPYLWTILADINLTRWKQSSTASYSGHIQELLRRSGDMDLTIFVYAPGVYEDEAKKNPIINLLLRHSQRWGALVFCAGIPVIKLFCENANTDPIFPRLRKLDLNMCVRPPGMKIVGFARAPLLEDVSVSGLFPDQLLLPYEQLTKYREGTFHQCSDTVPAFMHQVLTHGTRLERLEILGLNYFFPSIPDQTRNIKVLHLRLDYIRNSDLYGERLLDMLTLPFLEELKIRGMNEGDNTPVKNLIFRSVNTNPQFALRTLCLRGLLPPSSAGSLWPIMYLTPYLEELDIDLPDISDMERIIENMGPSGCLSRLRRIVLHLALKDLDARWRTTLDHLSRNLEGGSEYRGSQNQEPQLRLVFPTLRKTRDAQDLLNSWNKLRDDYSQKLVLSRLQEWRLKLHNILASINDESSTTYRKDASFTSNFKHRIDIGFGLRLEHLFKEMEEFELECDKCTCLYLSRIHHSLRRLGELKITTPSLYISEAKQYKLRKRSVQLLEKWQPILLDDLKEKIRWVCKGSRSLIFVPGKHAIRRSPQAVDLIYGIGGGVDEGEILWPDKL